MKSFECNNLQHGYCIPCSCNCHTKPESLVTMEDCVALARILERQYISYDDLEAHAAVNKLFRIVRNETIKLDR